MLAQPTIGIKGKKVYHLEWYIIVKRGTFLFVNATNRWYKRIKMYHLLKTYLF